MNNKILLIFLVFSLICTISGFSYSPSIIHSFLENGRDLVFVYSDHYPLSYYDYNKKEATGSSIELVRWCAAEYGFFVNFINENEIDFNAKNQKHVDAFISFREDNPKLNTYSPLLKTISYFESSKKNVANDYFLVSDDNEIICMLLNECIERAIVRGVTKRLFEKWHNATVNNKENIISPLMPIYIFMLILLVLTITSFIVMGKVVESSRKKIEDCEFRLQLRFQEIEQTKQANKLLQNELEERSRLEEERRRLAKLEIIEH